MLNRRDFVLGSGAAVTIPGLVRAQPARKSKTLKFMTGLDLASLDPVWTSARTTRIHGYAVFDTLYGVNEKLEVSPQMVAGHVVSKDQLTWTMTLRDGLRFHDGEPVLGRDVVASIKRWAARDALGHELMAVTNEIASPNDKTIVLRLSKPFPMLPMALGKANPTTAAIMPERIARTPPGTQIKEAIGSGPLRFLANEWVPGARAAYQKFEHYVPRQEPGSFVAGGKRALVDRVEILIMPDGTTAVSAMVAGEADALHGIGSDYRPILERAPGIRMVRSPAPQVMTLTLNHLQPPFNDPAIRRALLSVVDQVEFMTAAAGTNRDDWEAKTGYFNPSSPMASDAGMEALNGPRNIEAARRALASSGYNGSPVVLLDPANIAHTHACTLVAKKMLERIGFTVRHQTMDFGTMGQRRTIKGPVNEGGWSVMVATLTGTIGFDPSNNLQLQAGGVSGPSWFGWPDSPTIERLRREWMFAPDMAAQKEICRQIQLQAFKDVPYIPLGSRYSFNVVGKGVTGFKDELPVFFNVEKS